MTEEIIKKVLDSLGACASAGNTAEMRCIALVLDRLSGVASVRYRATASRLAGRGHRGDSLDIQAKNGVDAMLEDLERLRNSMEERRKSLAERGAGE